MAKMAADRYWLSEVRALIEGVVLSGPRLRRISTAVVADHLRKNPVSVAHAAGGPGRLLRFIGERPVPASVAVALIHMVVLAVTALCPPSVLGPQVPTRFADYFRDLQTINLALLGAQATLLGLVYPLVIALVGLLFQESGARTGRLTIYFKETEAAAVGALSLALVAAIGLQSLTYAHLPLKMVGAMTVLNLLWFLANLGGLAVFVLRSLDFIRPSRRFAMTKRYVANTAWPEQLKATVLANRLQGAEAYGYLTGLPQPGVVGLVNPYDFDPPLLKLRFADPMELRDVRFGVLNALIRSQARAAARGLPVAGLSFAVRSGWTYQGEIALLRGEGVVGWAERQLARHGFVFRRPSKAEPAEATAVLLKEIANDALAQFEAGRYDEFDRRLDDLTELHGFLYGLAEAPTGAESRFSYAQIEEGFGTVGGSWVRAYRHLVARVGDHVEADPRFLERCAYLPGSIYRRARAVAPFEALTPVFELHAILLWALMGRAAKVRADHAPAAPAPGATFSVPGSLGDAYRRAWLNFVAGWESFGDELARSPDHGPISWEAIQERAPGMLQHLRESAIMVAKAAQLGEFQAVGWATDMLLKWDDRMARGWREHGNDHWALHRALPTLALVEKPWIEVEALPLTVQDQPRSPHGVFAAALRNGWLDTLVSLTASLLGRAAIPTGTEPADGAGAAATALFLNTGFDPDAAAHPREAPIQRESLLRSLIRTADRQSGYASTIEGLSERIDQLKGPNYISGRVYGWSGSLGLGDAADPFIVLLAAATVPPAAGRRRGHLTLDDELRALLLPEDDARRRNILDRLEGLQASLAAVDVARAGPLISMLLGAPVPAVLVAARLAAVGDILTECKRLIDEARLAAITAAETDPSRLAAVERGAARGAFETVSFGLSVFPTITETDAPLTRFTHVMNNVRRGVFSRPLLSADQDLEADAEQWLGSRVGSRVLADTLNQGATTRRSVSTATGWWKAMKAALADVEAAGMTPLIVRGGRDAPDWLMDWHYGVPGGLARPGDLRLEWRNAVGPGYDFHLNDVAVHSDPGAGPATWILGREMFEEVEFELFGPDRRIRASLTPDPHNPWRADVRLEWGRRVAMRAGPKWRIGLRRPGAA